MLGTRFVIGCVCLAAAASAEVCSDWTETGHLPVVTDSKGGGIRVVLTAEARSDWSETGHLSVVTDIRGRYKCLPAMPAEVYTDWTETGHLSVVPDDRGGIAVRVRVVWVGHRRRADVAV